MEDSKNSDFNDFSVFKKSHDEKLAAAFTMQHKEKYLPAIKAMCYSLLGLPLRDHRINVMTEQLDTRLSYIIAIRSGNWKKGFENVAKKFCDELNYRYSKLVSLHHEQLVGKNITVWEKTPAGNKVPRIKEAEGYFRDDYLVASDALPLLNAKEYETARNYFIQAWDELDHNEITKKLVDHTREEALRYCPECVSFLCIQDKPVNKNNIDTGLVRKCQIIYINAPEVNEEDYLNRALKTPQPDYEYLIKITKKAKIALKVEWMFLREAEELIAKRAAKLKQQIETQGDKGKEYATMLQYGIQNYIYKYSAILAFYHALESNEKPDVKIVVTSEVCQAASEDYELILSAAFEHWLKYAEESNVLTLTRWEQFIVKELRLAGAVSEETAIVGNPQFLTDIAAKANIGKVTLYNACGWLREKHIIEMRQVGKGELGEPNSKMWLLK